MAFKKAHEVDNAIKKPDKNFRAVLFYGPDSGLVIERANHFAKNTGVDLNDSFSYIRLTADEVGEDKTRLADEVYTVAMFGGDRLIKISGSTRKNLTDIVRPILENPLEDCWLIIEAGELQKSSGLRTSFEKSKYALALPCYQDDARALENLINDELIEQGVQIDRETINYLKPLLGGDRLASRNELKKLSLYCLDKGRVEIDDINEIVGDASTFDVNDIIDSVTVGDTKKLQENIGRLLELGVSADMLLIMTLRHFQTLHEMKSQMESQKLNAASVIAKARPPIFFNRKNSFSVALNKWNSKSIERALDRLDNASFSARANPTLANSIAGTNLLALTIEAQRTR